jgi:predicted PurR-regulated permease PerM
MIYIFWYYKKIVLVLIIFLFYSLVFIFFLSIEIKFLQNLDNKVPGPQKYESKTLINGKGIIFNSKFSSSPGKTIAGRSKLAENKLKSK